MDENELDLIAKRYTNLELGMFIVMHMKKAETASYDVIRSREIGSAKVYYEVLGHKIKVIENV